MSKPKQHHGLSVDVHLDGEGGEYGSYVTSCCCGDWREQQKCRFFLGYLMPPVEGDTCLYKDDAFGCDNPWCAVAAMEKAAAILKDEIRRIKEEHDL